MRASDVSGHPVGLDRLGISASVLCILHCTALPVVTGLRHDLKLLRHCRLCGHSHCTSPVQPASAPTAE